MGKNDVNRPDMLKQAQFLKTYCALVGAFQPDEVVFMAYMADLANLRGKGYNTIRSKREHMANTAIGLRVFDKCVAKMTGMGLLEKIPVGGMCDYVWDMEAYRRLVEMLAGIRIPARRNSFCKTFFEGQERDVRSIRDSEIDEWKDKFR